MVLCSLCRSVCEVDWTSPEAAQERFIAHYRFYADLRRSAADGCDLCRCLREGLNHWMRHYAKNDEGCGWAASYVEEYLERTRSDNPKSGFFVARSFSIEDSLTETGDRHELPDGFRYGFYDPYDGRGRYEQRHPYFEHETDVIGPLFTIKSASGQFFPGYLKATSNFCR
jgi:hypothetical protein